MPAYQPKTGAKCTCRRGVERDNCPTCEGTGWVIDFRAIHTARAEKPVTCLDCTVLPPFSIVLCPLHAAAPELLAALEKIVRRHALAESKAEKVNALNWSATDARAAIAKATEG